MSVQVVETYVVWVGKTDRIASFRKVEGYEDMFYASEYAVSLEELGDSFSDGTTPEQAFDAKMLDDAINRFLRALPDDARNTFIGRYYFFDSLKEVATYGDTIVKVRTKGVDPEWVYHQLKNLITE